MPFQAVQPAGSSAPAEPEPAPERADGSSAAPSAKPWPATVVTVLAPPAVNSAPPAGFSAPAAEPEPAPKCADGSSRAAFAEPAPALPPEILFYRARDGPGRHAVERLYRCTILLLGILTDARSPWPWHPTHSEFVQRLLSFVPQSHDLLYMS